MNPRIAAVVPCAGLSSRMEGRFKPLLPLGGRRLVEHVVDTVKSAGVEEIVVVLGHRAGELSPIVAAAGARAVRNPRFDEGMFTSIRAGVASLAPDIAAFFLLPADIPLVRPATLRRMISQWARRPGRLLHPVFAGRRGHPPLIPADLAPTILHGDGAGGLRALLAGREDRAVDVPVADESILFDVDRREDYEAARYRLSRRGVPSDAECDALLSDVHPVPAAVAAHGRRVRRVASAICRALNRNGAGLDEGLAASAALLHDIAKGAPDHAAAGARMLREMGFDRAADVVAAHTDLPQADQRPAAEAAVVYLADKLTSGEAYVSLESKFSRALARFGDDPAARAAVMRRRDAAMAVRAEIERRTGRTIEALVAEAFAAPADGHR